MVSQYLLTLEILKKFFFINFTLKFFLSNVVTSISHCLILAEHKIKNIYNEIIVSIIKLHVILVIKMKVST